MQTALVSVVQTPCVLLRDGAPVNQLRVTVRSDAAGDAVFAVDGAECWRGVLEEGLNEFLSELPEPRQPREAVCTLTGAAPLSVSLRPCRHWEIHVVQLSHHDPGYTDIPSHVLQESARWLREALDHLDEAEAYPDDAKPRIVIEQTYSLYEFLRRCDPADRERMIRRIRQGDVEVTALWANLIGELLSPEECIRALYPAQRIARETGVPILAAEHNDIPGFPWGYCTALCRAGVRFFAPGLPLYYDWGGDGYSSFWDQKQVFGHDGPGAFWWESAEGDRLLFWCNNTGCGGESDPAMPDLLPALERLDASDWPYSVLRWPVQGAVRDNSPYIAAYAQTIRAWNETYLWPHLISSTETRFYHAFLDRLDRPLPVRRGGVDGQDYPIASTSQASTSALARETHFVHRHAETLFTLASGDGALTDQRSKLRSAMQDLHMADEHAYGFSDPSCPGQRTSWWEHGVYAARASSDALDVLGKSMYSIAGRIRDGAGRCRLTLFHLSGEAGNLAVTIPLRNSDICGTEIHPDENGILRSCTPYPPVGTPLPEGYPQGCFRLTDPETGERIPFELHSVAWDDPSDLAAQRAGIGSGTKKMGLFAVPRDAGLELRFTLSMPAYGCRTLALTPSHEPEGVPAAQAREYIENEFYRVRFDHRGVTSILDKTTGAELLDSACPHRLGELLVRNINDDEVLPMRVGTLSASVSQVGSTLRTAGDADGVYAIVAELSLRQGVDALSLSVRVIKGPKPLQTLFLAFPFAGTGVRCQQLFHEASPAVTSLPGSHSDAMTVADYVRTQGSDIVWNSANAPVAFLSHLWRGYISPAHRCVMDTRHRQPLKPEAFDTGHIYSVLSCNNFGTNFFASQLSDTVYRYSFAGRHGRQCAVWGDDAAGTVHGVFTGISRGSLPLTATFLETGGLRVLTLKHAEDAEGLILRLINDTAQEITAPLRIWGAPLSSLWECDAVERPLRALSDSRVTVPAGHFVTLRFSAALPSD